MWVEGVWASVGAVITGIGIKVLDRSMISMDKKLDEAAEIRKELRQEAIRLSTEVEELKKTVDTWKEKFFVVFGEHEALKGEYSAMQAKMEACSTRARRVRQLLIALQRRGQLTPDELSEIGIESLETL
jgi:uncharacterized coiled-coil DUF342 family protein